MKLDHFVSLANEIHVRNLRLKKLIPATLGKGDSLFIPSPFRAVIQEFIPENLGMGQGMIMGKNDKNFPSDLFLYKKNSFVPYKEANLMLIPAEAVIASISIFEDISKVEQGLENWIQIQHEIKAFSAIFSWEGEKPGTESLLNKLS